MMQIPRAFLKLTAYFHQDVDLIYPTGDDMLRDALAALTPQEREEIKAYLTELIDGKFNEMQLRAIWRSTKAEISPFRGAEGNCKEFLKYILTSM
jgi:predicted phosphatase